MPRTLGMFGRFRSFWRMLTKAPMRREPTEESRFRRRFGRRSTRERSFEERRQLLPAVPRASKTSVYSQPHQKTVQKPHTRANLRNTSHHATSLTSRAIPHDHRHDMFITYLVTSSHSHHPGNQTSRHPINQTSPSYGRPPPQQNRSFIPLSGKRAPATTNPKGVQKMNLRSSGWKADKVACLIV